MKYLAITAATILICGVAGVSTKDGAKAEETVQPAQDETIQTDFTPVEYIDFDPYYINVDLGKNEG
tara:strand:+ start:399 stop:596 length:198 start_codon:yes stop_codon:yes gene_type:complete